MPTSVAGARSSRSRLRRQRSDGGIRRSARMPRKAAFYVGETEDLREAVFELQQYFSDRLPPLMVADSIALLTRYPVKVVALEIHAWMAAQHHSHGAVAPVSDYLFHAVKKLSTLGELELLSKEALGSYLQD